MEKFSTSITGYKKEEVNKFIDDVIKQVEDFNKKVKKQLAMASDEFFIKADYPIPEKKYYNNFAQLEDGVGAIRLLMDDFAKRKKKLPKTLKSSKEITFAVSERTESVDDTEEEHPRLRNQ